jgi:hypothetical protein
MYTVEKTWLTGWVMLPCFTIKTLKGERYEAQLTCGKVAEWIFIHFFAAFWSGKVHITGEYTED